MKRRPGRPRGFDRDAALDTAMRTFWAHGYETTSVADLTAAMGINAPALYAAFGDKRRLFLEALALYGGDPEVQAMAIRDAPTARDAAAAVLRGAIERFTGNDTPRGCLIASGLATGSEAAADVRAEGVRIRAGLERALRERIVRDVAAGLLPDEPDADALAASVTCTVQGLSTLARDGATPERLKAVAEVVLAGWRQVKENPQG